MVGTASHEPAHPERGVPNEVEPGPRSSSNATYGAAGCSMPEPKISARSQVPAWERGSGKLQLPKKGSYACAWEPAEIFLIVLSRLFQRRDETLSEHRGYPVPFWHRGFSSAHRNPESAHRLRYRHDIATIWKSQGWSRQPGQIREHRLTQRKKHHERPESKGRGRQDTTIESESITQSTG
uniref:Uncharacterized protein n=1 Tax=Candidatus Kentrum sp. LFY TaxID=2126342 RepID=A0A450WAC3_9GAMM|nr:MAG: hypothetical protein BECKLFY1418C_GA0070996_100528 [Candidatus Kentron sp. LFY]